MKENRIAIFGLSVIMGLVAVGCTPITQANAADAAAAVGLGTNGSYGAGSKSILAQTIIDNRKVFEEAQAKALSVDFTASYGGGTVTFATVSEASLPDSSQDGSFPLIHLACSITYSNVKVTYEGKDYTLNGTIYARLAASTYLSFVLTGDVKIAGAIDDEASIDVVFNGSLTGYAFTGTVNGYSVSSNLTVK